MGKSQWTRDWEQPQLPLSAGATATGKETQRQRGQGVRGLARDTQKVLSEDGSPSI